jgi:hypothetical protein
MKMNNKNSMSEIIRLAAAYSAAAGRSEPNGSDFMVAAVAANVPASDIRAVAAVAATEWTNSQINPSRSQPGILKPRADALREKIAYLEKASPNGKSIVATRAELARVLEIDPIA